MTLEHTASEPSVGRVRTGIPGLDDVLSGGLPKNRLHLVVGAPGTGKTTLGLQFLIEGARRGEHVLLVALSETSEEVMEIGRSHGWDLDGVTIHEIVPGEESLKPAEQYTIFHPSEIELTETIGAALEPVEKEKPSRVVIDSLSELRLLASDPLRYRHQMLALKQYFAGRSCTVLLLDNATERDSGLASVAHTVIDLDSLIQEFGSHRRRLRVEKMRASQFRGGYHDFDILRGGLRVFPRLVAAEHEEDLALGVASSGVRELDDLLGGGLRHGTSVLLSGPSGAGKSAIATQYAVAAAERGERSALYLFDERAATFMARAEALGMDVRPHLEAGRIAVTQLDPAQISPGELTQDARREVEQNGTRLIVIDSLNGYLNAMAEERAVLVQLHELLTYLGARGALTFLTVAQHGMLGPAMETPLDASYLADTVILLRYFESFGLVRKAIAVMKKRTGAHEQSLREFRLGPGIQVGQPLRDFQGVLSGVPTYMGEKELLLDRGDK